jgi:hypothetical protein
MHLGLEVTWFCRQAESGQATIVRPPAHSVRPTLRGRPLAVLSAVGVARGRVWLGLPAAVRPSASSSREVSNVMIRWPRFWENHSARAQV